MATVESIEQTVAHLAAQGWESVLDAGAAARTRTDYEVRSEIDHWEEVRRTLLEWGANTYESDEEFDPPSPESLATILKVVTAIIGSMRPSQGWLPRPDVLLPTGSGGVSFEWQSENHSRMMIECTHDGSLKVLTFGSDGKVRSRFGV